MSLHLFNPSTDVQVDPGAEAVARPITFDGLFGWLHSPAKGGRETGVILISPLGRDARCAHRPMRQFADQLARAGYPTLRYDHRGTGDSLPLEEPEADAMTEWLAGVRRAIAVLRAETGARQIVLGGVRLGATMAMLSADQADGLMLLAPVLSGRSWLRRLRFSADAASARAGGPADADALDTDGLELSAATAAHLNAVVLEADPAERPIPPRAKLFVAAQNRMVGAYAAALTQQGAAIKTHDFPSFRELFLDAHSNQAPETVFDCASLWLTKHFARMAPLQAVRTAAPKAELRPEGAIERAVSFGDDLQGVFCEPDRDVRATRAVLFCNTGGDPRAGIGGFATRAARDLARHGIASLRFDFAGLGDSPSADPAPVHIFETPRDADMRAALDFLEAQGLNAVTLVGVCAGAYHALQMAWNEPRIRGVFAVSPVKLVWRAGDSLNFDRKDDGKATQAYAQAAKDLQTWRRLLAGGVDLGAVSQTLVLRLRGRLKGMALRLAPQSPANRMDQFLRRGGRACLVMGLEDASLDEIESHFGHGGRRLNRVAGASLEVLPDLDHGLARSASRDLALERLMTWLDAAPGAPSKPS